MADKPAVKLRAAWSSPKLSIPKFVAITNAPELVTDITDDIKWTAEKLATSARSNWRKVFAARQFLNLAKLQSSQAPAKLVIGSRYRVGRKIANGAFGQLRMGYDLKGDNPEAKVAIKVESSNAKLPLLFLEYRFYKMMGSRSGLPKIYHYGPCGKYNTLVMELLGPNLEDLFTTCERAFSMKTILMLAIQLISLIEMVHSFGIVYRDIKPENCLIGRNKRSNMLHLVDFGLAKEFIDPETGKHIMFAQNKSITGTVRYMSINAHRGCEQSRRDDLEALGYMLFYFLSGGNLPWQGIKHEDTRKRYQIIADIKEETPVNELGKPHPWEFSVYLNYCKSLKFSQKPDYTYLKNLFRSCMNRLGEVDDGVFDWNWPTLEGVPSPEKKDSSVQVNETSLRKNVLAVNKRRMSKSCESIMVHEVAHHDTHEDECQCMASRGKEDSEGAKRDRSKSLTVLESQEFSEDLVNSVRHTKVNNFSSTNTVNEILQVKSSEKEQREEDKVGQVINNEECDGSNDANDAHKPVATIEPIVRQVQALTAFSKEILEADKPTRGYSGKVVAHRHHQDDQVNQKDCCSASFLALLKKFKMEP